MIRATRFGKFAAATLFVAATAAWMPTLAEDPAKPAPAPAPAAAPAPAPAPAAAPAAPMVESIKIIFDDKAKNDGQIVLVFTPAGGAAKSVSVTIQKKMDRKDVARDVAKELSVALGDGYKVDRYDPDKIKVSGKKDAKFSLTIASMTANGLSVRLK
jgi:hypothetical protein